MPTKREREYYAMGYRDGISAGGPREDIRTYAQTPIERGLYTVGAKDPDFPKRKRKLSAWNKFVKANSKKPRFVLRSGKLNLKKLAVAFRKTPAGRKKKRR